MQDYCTSGLPDIIGSYYGYFFAVEIKNPRRSRYPKSQRRFANLILGSEAFYRVAISLTEVKTLMGEIRAKYLEQKRGSGRKNKSTLEAE